MRTIPTIAGAVLALAAAGAVMAAAPTAAPTTKPLATPAPAATPAPTPAPTKAPASASKSAPASMSWSAAIVPLRVTTGTASIKQNADGTGTITVTLHGLRADTPWFVDIDSGTSTAVHDASRHEIATRSGMGLDKVSSDTFRIRLTASEMKAFAKERAASGAVVLVTDGTNRSAAVFAAG